MVKKYGRYDVISDVLLWKGRNSLWAVSVSNDQKKALILITY